MDDKTVIRRGYLLQLSYVKNTPDIKVITGIRRSGKSELLKAFIREREKEEPALKVIWIDFNDLQFEPLKEYHALHSYIEEQYVKGKTNMLCIDEVQECVGFEHCLNSLHTSKKYDIYVTGSNAFLRGSELATYFTGRYIEIKVLPFSFSEFSDFYPDMENLQERFESYTLQGGMPGGYVYEREADRRKYVRSVYQTIVERDLVQRYKIRDVVTLKKICEYLMDNIGNLSSGNRISAVLSSGKKKDGSVSVNTVLSYMDHLCECFMFYESRRFDIQGNTYLERNSKFYLPDHGFRMAVLGGKNINYGRIYENMVYVELLRRGYEVYTGKLYQKEVDFVAMRQSEQLYIQVCDNIDSEETLLREITPLLSIRDAFPKIILANTHHPVYTRQGVPVYDLARWLLDEK